MENQDERSSDISAFINECNNDVGVAIGITYQNENSENAADIEHLSEEVTSEESLKNNLSQTESVPDNILDPAIINHSAMASLDNRLNNNSFDTVESAFEESDNATSDNLPSDASPSDVSFAEELVNVTTYDVSQSNVPEITEDNLHGLSIQSEFAVVNGVENKLSDTCNTGIQYNTTVNIKSDCINPDKEGNFLNRMATENTFQKIDGLENSVVEKDSEHKDDMNKSVVENEVALPSHDSSILKHGNATKFVKSPVADQQVQSMIQENLEKLSPKKEVSLSQTAKEALQKSAANITFQDVVPDRPPRINPFNNTCTDEHEADDLWQMRKSPPNVIPSSDVQSLPSHNHHFPSPNAYQNSNPSSCSMQQKDYQEEDIKGPFYPPNPQFELMPTSNTRQRQETNIEVNPSVADIDAAVKEIKMKNSVAPPTTPLDNPWIKIEDPKIKVNFNDSTTSQATKQRLGNEPIPEEASKQKNDSLEKPLLQPNSFIRPLIEAAGPCDPADLIEGIIFAANYLGSTQLQSERNPGKNARMLQAQEAVGRIKAPEGESQPSVEVDLFISTDKVKVLNADTQETMMDHTLRSISYIADIGKLLVIMAKRKSPQKENHEDHQIMREPKPQRSYRVICHVFSSIDSHLMAQAIGQAFNVAYQQFLTANGIEPQTLTRDDYNQLLDMQEMYHDDLVHYSKRENVKDIWVEKKKGENLGVVIVESGWGSIVPTVILANLQHGGPAERCGKLSIGDQIMNVNGTSLVGLPLTTCQSIIKGLKAQSIARLHIVSCPPVVTVLIKRPDLKYQLGFSVQDGIICSLMRGGIAERGGVRVGHRIIEINNQSVVATQHEKIVQTLVSSVGEIQMKTMPAMMYRLLTGQEQPIYI